MTDTAPSTVTLPPRPGDGLVDLLDRVLARGAVVSGDVLVSLAGIDLLRLDLRLLLISVETALEGATPAARDRGTP